MNKREMTGISANCGSSPFWRRQKWVLFHWLLIPALSLLLPTLSHAEAIKDVRVLIDVSGSMKKNDPNNLRSPAVKMLVGLMPENTRSGIWTFGRYVNMQVKLGKVDKPWKEKAMIEAGKIHSRGLFTNIEDAVKKASNDWVKPDPRYERHLILLTDGMVDVSKDEKLNELSRRRLLHDILPGLEAADATIHSIALSKNTDEKLLSSLSGATKGAFVQVDTAEELQKVFFKLFEKAVKPDTLPIEENKFTVDKHVSDITILIFLAEDSPATQLTLPSGQTWSAKQHPETVNWHHEKGYDLITVKGPEAGEWKLQAKIDPDNRVMVVTNLRLKVDKLPNTIMLGDNFDVRARLLEDGKTVTNQNLLAKTKFEVKQIDAEGRVNSIPLDDDGQSPDVIKGDGIYSKEVDNIEKAGEYELSVRAKSLTFKRAIRHSLQVFDSPANLEISQEAEGKPFILKVQPHAGLIRPESVSMQYTLESGESAIIQQLDDQTWSVEISPEHANKKFTLTLAGTRYTDEPIKMDFEQVVAVTDKAQSVSLKIKSAVSKKEPKPEVKKDKPEVEDSKEETADEAAVEEVKDGFNWWIVLALVIVVNAILVTAVWFGFRAWKKSKQAQMDDVEAGLDDIAAIAEEPKKEEASSENKEKEPELMPEDNAESKE